MSYKPKEVKVNKNGGYWMARWWDSDGKRRGQSLGPIAHVSKSEAKRRADALMVKMIETPAYRDSERGQTIAGWTKEIEPIIASELAPNTLRLYRRTLDRLAKSMGERRRLDSVKLLDAERWLASMRSEGLADSTVHGELRRARTLWSRAVDHGVAAENPFTKAKTPRGVASASRLLTEDEITRLIEAAPAAHWRNMIALCGLAGLRRGEALIFTWDAIRWGEGKIVVQQPKTAAKNGATRETRMEPELESILLRSRDEIEGPLVAPHCGSNQDAMMFGGQIRRKLKSGRVSIQKRTGIVERAGIEGFDSKPLQTLRSSRATLWRKHYPEHVVDSWLGHSLEVARRHYVSVDDRYYADHVRGTNLAQTEQMTEHKLS